MDNLTVWTIYDHPRDYPEYFVARKFLDQELTHHIYYSTDLNSVRAFVFTELLELGITPVKMDRDFYDDPKIIETWF